MDRFRQKSKKEKPMKYVDKDQAPLFITDVKAIKENLKIKEILRTVKMNSSMRIKAPKGSKVMQNKDFNDNEDIFGVDQTSDDQTNENQNTLDPPSATNPDVVVVSNSNEERDEAKSEEPNDKPSESEEEILEDCIENESSSDTKMHESVSVPEGLQDFVLISEENKQDVEVTPDVKIESPSPSEILHVKARDRKLSLDQTMLSRRGGLNEPYIPESMLNRAISMSSGLDSASGQNRRKSRSNRYLFNFTGP
ncbi:hypothetical protein HF086_006890 [Spodoptera exigua]|uniref:Uncharacterized protein n=1 Tax=Spodoptera exigua TaxID=7107 RepID=A0A922SGT0_SPOEX|nr:hypothetical protein HF086_006890 [Spodoptera exigua]